MKNSIRCSLSLILIMICLPSSTFAEENHLCSKQRSKLMSSGLVLEFSTDFQKWYVSKKWYSLTSDAKRHFINRFKFMNMYCTDNPLMNVTIYDNSTLRQVAEYYDKIIIHDLSDPFRYSSPG